MKPIKIEYEIDSNFAYVLDDTKAPFDGEPVLIKTSLGWAEAWWQKGTKHEYQEGIEYDGFVWVVLDDTTTATIDEADLWMPLPEPPS